MSLPKNRFGRFFSKIRRRLKSSRCDSAPVEVASIQSNVRTASNESIETVPFAVGVSHDARNDAKVPATLQSSSTVEADATEVNNDAAASFPSKSSKLHWSKHRQERYGTLGESIKKFRGTRHHCLFDEANPIVAYFSEATLYPIPEHGKGLCYVKYTTVYQYGQPESWSIIHNNINRPQHRGLAIAYNGIAVNSLPRRRSRRRHYHQSRSLAMKTVQVPVI